MKMRSLFVVVMSAVLLWPAGAVLAQDLPDVPGIDAARNQIGATRASTRQSPVSNLPALDALPAPATGSGSPSRLPATGVDTKALALDGLTLLGAGTLLLMVRRRLAAPGSSA